MTRLCHVAETSVGRLKAVALTQQRGGGPGRGCQSFTGREKEGEEFFSFPTFCYQQHLLMMYTVLLYYRQKWGHNLLFGDYMLLY